MYDILGLIFEVLFLLLGIYVYLYSRGVIKLKGEAAEKFRTSNAGWMRILALALIALMVVNIFIHIQTMIKA